MAKSAKKKKTKPKIEARLKKLEAEVDSLRKHFKSTETDDSKKERFWAIENLKQRYPKQGGVAFGGYVTLPTKETYAWQVDSASEDLYKADWTAAQAALTALAHPVRLSILQAILQGKRETKSLQAIPEMGTTGQLYHHLKELESAGWIRQPRRGEYNLLAERVVPLLAILAACEVTEIKSSK